MFAHPLPLFVCDAVEIRFPVPRRDPLGGPGDGGRGLDGEIARGTVEWTDDETTGLTVPRSVPGMDIESFAVADHVEDYERKLRDLRGKRRAYLSEFEDLDEAIRDAVY